MDTKTPSEGSNSLLGGIRHVRECNDGVCFASPARQERR